MARRSKDMFGDRRSDSDRRCQNLPMPAGLDRRLGSRRENGFQNSPWWLNVAYSEDLVSETASEKIRLRSNDHKKSSND